MKSKEKSFVKHNFILVITVINLYSDLCGILDTYLTKICII